MIFYKHFINRIVSIWQVIIRLHVLQSKVVSLVLISSIVTVNIFIYFGIQEREKLTSKQIFQIIKKIKVDKTRNGSDIIRILISLRKYSNDQLIIDNINYSHANNMLVFELSSEHKSAIYDYINNLVRANKAWKIDKVSFTPNIDLSKHQNTTTIKKAEAYKPFIFSYLGIDINGNKHLQKNNSKQNQQLKNNATVSFKIQYK